MTGSRRIERVTIESALAEEGQNPTPAANRLGITRRALIYRMGKLGLNGLGATPLTACAVIRPAV